MGNVHTLEYSNGRIILSYSNGPMPNCFPTSVSKFRPCEMEQAESKLQISLSPKFKEVGNYLTEMEKNIENINSTIEKIETKIEEFRKYKVTEEENIELKMLMLDLNRDFAKAEYYRKRVEEALPSLYDQSGVNLKVEGVSAMGLIVAAAVRGYVALPNAPVVGAVLSAADTLMYLLLSVSGKHEEHHKACKELETQLKILKEKIEIQKMDSDVIDEKMGLLRSCED